jgi:imidazole glycerol phosphate synthase subunit HisF
MTLHASLRSYGHHHSRNLRNPHPRRAHARLQPVVASGGAGAPAHIPDVLRDAGADAALVAGILHDGLTTVSEIKAAMQASGIATRSVGG